MSKALSVHGEASYLTEHHRYPLPAPIKGRFQPTFDGFGRYKLPGLKSEGLRAWTRATTICKTLDDTSNLDRWRRRQLMKGLTLRPDLAAAALAAFESAAENKAIDALGEDAMVAAGSSEAAEFGTAVHAWLEYVDHGRTLPAQVPEMYRPHADAYLTRLAAHALTPLPEFTERIVLNTRAGAAGTLDRIYQAADGTLVMGDVKTSRSLDFSWMAYAMQLTIYTDADLMLSLDGTSWEPMPKLNPDYAVLMHCPSNAPEDTAAVTYDLAFGRQALDTALLVRQLRREARKKVPYLHALPIPDAVTHRQHAAVLALRLSRTEADLAKVWEEYQDVWDDALTQLGMTIAESLRAESSR